ncbi:MAG: phosphatase PAP2 family protein [Bacteroidetes bacterium]|nr:phosphatase PAP2 family protein [Bacteroidota bacterium]
MKKTLLQNLAFLLPYLLFLISAGIFLSLHSKAEAHILLNQYRSEFLDYFFRYITFFGDFVTVIAVTFLLCLYKYRFAILVGGSNILSAGITQSLKHSIFDDVVRPKKFFEGMNTLNLVPGFENYLYNSFPSGHSTSAFTTFFCLALVVKNKMLKFLMFAIALTVGFSRVYLSQHFLNDVYAGSLIGVITSLAVYRFVFLSERPANAKWMENSLMNRK